MTKDWRVQLSESSRETSMWVIGAPGSGKSRAIECWAMQDILAGRGCAVLDPAGDVFDHLLTRIAASPRREELSKRLIIIDPTEEKWTVGFNPLESVEGIPNERLASFLRDILIKVWKLDPMGAPRMVRLLGFTFLALLELHLTLLELPQFLVDSEYREQQLQRCTNQEVVRYFEKEYPESRGAIQQWSGPVLNKVGEFIFDPDVRLMLATKATINFRQMMDEQKILLVNLAKGKIGEGTSALLGAFIVAHFQKAALSRADTPNRPRTYLYLDEFQNYTTDNIKDILAESRKYGLSLILAHQYLKQLEDPNLKAAVQNTTGTIVCFRVGHEDATTLVKEIFEPGEIKKTVLADSKSGHLTESVALDHVGLIGLLKNQDPSHFWMKYRMKRNIQAVKQRALSMPDLPLTDQLREARQELLADSMSRYGRLKAEAREDILRRTKATGGFDYDTFTSYARSVSQDDGTSNTVIPLLPPGGLRRKITEEYTDIDIRDESVSDEPTSHTQDDDKGQPPEPRPRRRRSRRPKDDHP